MSARLERLAAHDAIPGDRARTRIAWLLLAFLLALGGGGSPAPRAELACQLATALAIVVWLLAPPGQQRQSARPALTVAALLVAVPLLQLVPLPPSVWHALPGHATLRDALALVGAETSWHPLSIAPASTLAGLLAMLPPLAVMVMVSRLGEAGRMAIVTLIAGFAFVSVLLGTLQMTSAGGTALLFYGQPDSGVLFGFQINRNAEADILLCGLLALAALRSAGRRARGRALDLAYVVLGLLLVLAVVLTRSRTGIFLIPLALAFAAIIATPDGLRTFASRMTWRHAALASVAVLVAGGVAFLLAQTPVLGRVLVRFDFSREFRPELWIDTRYAIAQYWPLGSGLGTFVQAFFPAERLEVLDPLLANRAHNDYLELALEGGVPLLAAWAAAQAMVVARLWQTTRARLILPRPQRLFAMGVLIIVALHSMVDYPLRTMAMAALTAAATGLVLAARKPESGRKLTESKEAE